MRLDGSVRKAPIPKTQDEHRLVIPENIGWIEYTLNSQERDYVWRCIDNRKHDTRKRLAGNIDSSYSLMDRGDWFFINTLTPLINTYRDKFENLGKDIPTSANHPYYMREWWVNYQKQNEFNPSHRHTGVWSFVIWMKIPYGNEDQNKNNVTNFPCKGDFQFQYSNILGQTRSFKYTLDKSWEGHMVIFPSQLIHQVYPFYNCDEERISVSWNILVNTSKRL